MNTQNNDTPQASIDEPLDRLVDVALRELVGGATPPDLSAKIVASALDAQPVPSTLKHSSRERHPARWFAAAIAAMLMVGGTSMLYLATHIEGTALKIAAKSNRVGNARPLTTRLIDRGQPQTIPDLSAPPVAPTDQLVNDPTGQLINESNAALAPAAPIEPAAQAPPAAAQSREVSLRTQLASGSNPQGNEQYFEFENHHDRFDAEAAGRETFGVRGATGQSWPTSEAKSADASTYVPLYAYTDPRLRNESGMSANAKQRLAGPGLRTNDDGLAEVAVQVPSAETTRDLRNEWLLNARLKEKAALSGLGDQYTQFVENPFIKAESGNAVSTFGIDVDTASYSNVRQFLLDMHQLPPVNAVRIEELVNYFHYDYVGPKSEDDEQSVKEAQIDIELDTDPVVLMMREKLDNLRREEAESGIVSKNSYQKQLDSLNRKIEETRAQRKAGLVQGKANLAQEHAFAPMPLEQIKKLYPTIFAPFAAHVEVAGCPWNHEHRLARIAVKGREMARNKRPPSNLVFLVDVSGSMDDPVRLPLVKYGLEQLTKELGENDHVAIVTYAGTTGVALPSTRGWKHEIILAALRKLEAGGSTAGGAGIQLAYQIAEENFIKGGTNRIILCTDGDFNVGTTNTDELQKLVAQKAKDTGVSISTLGFGRDNLNDAMMVAISDHGNGNYHYIDNRTEIRRVLVEQMTGTLVTIAKDVKIQVEFNPAKVAAYRLIGYEKRMLKTEDFNNDKKDAGEIGAGHTVTALYEIVPAGQPIESTPAVDELKYQQATEDEVNRKAIADSAIAQRREILQRMRSGDGSGELLTLKMRYKLPDGDTSEKLEWPVTDSEKSFDDASQDFRFAAAVAGFGMLLRDSQYKGDYVFNDVMKTAENALGRDEHGFRSEFLEMVKEAQRLKEK